MYAWCVWEREWVLYGRRDMQGCTIYRFLHDKGYLLGHTILIKLDGSLSLSSIPLWVTTITPGTF